MDKELNEAKRVLNMWNKAEEFVINDTDNFNKESYIQRKKAIETVLNRLEKYEKQLDLDYVDKNYIPKKKIEEKIKHKKNKLNQIENDNYRKMCLQAEIDILQELLEEK